MAQEYLPAPSNIRLADLMKEHNISQPELAKEIGCSKSTISRFISGAKGTLTHEQVLKIARLFNVSTDFLLGETNIPDRKNYDIAELGLSVEAAKNLYTGRVNAEVVNLLLENDTDPVIWRGPVIAGVIKQFWQDVIWKDVDYMFVDMPPGTGDVPLTVFQSIPIDGVIIVASPQELVSMIVGKAVKMAQMMNIPILGLVENMSYVACPDCGKKIYLFGQGKTAQAAAAHNLPLLAEMPIDPALASLTDAGEIESFQGDWLSASADKLEGK